MLNKILILILFTLCVEGHWTGYKERFLQKDGRVIDKKNNNITHSEAIGYTLYFAYKFQDDKAFDKVYQWYGSHMQKNQYGLIPWVWGEDGFNEWRTLDINNATDGDMWIAYSLLLMGERRGDTLMIEEAKMLVKAIKKHLLISLKDRVFLLPGKEGHDKNDGFFLNLSYYHFDILDAFFKETKDPIWEELSTDAEWLLHQSQFSSLKLHSDWIFIDNSLTIHDARNKMFGYDAIRIPLNIAKSNLSTRQSLLRPYKNFTNMMSNEIPLGTVLLENGTIALYDYCFGHLAVYNYLSEDKRFEKKVKKMMMEDKNNYYAYALYLFTTF